MLQELTIRDFAIIEKMDLEFQSQMTVLTGETGAGKSIIIDALGLLSGGRGSVDFIRKGANKAVIQGLFDVPGDSKTNDVLDEFGIDVESDGLILQRDIYRSGKNICRINGAMVNLTTLRRVGETLIDIHGQNEHQELMHPENHIKLLDGFDNSLAPLLNEYHERYADFLKKKKALEKRETNEKQWAQRMDMLQFQVQEIKSANLVSDEEEKLLSEKEELDNYQMIHEALETGYEAFNGEEFDVLGVLGNVMEEMNKVAGISDKLSSIADKISEAFYGLQDVGRDVSNELDTMEWDENRLDEIEARLETIHQLKRKYGDSIPQILAYFEKISAELDEMQQVDSDSSEQEESVKKARSEAMSLAAKLSERRKAVAKGLEKAIHHQLAELCMDKAVFEVKFLKENAAELNEDGIDRVEFYIQTNPGEEMGALAKIASGGELSRIMLALKTIFAQKQGVTSIIFDEVDTGVSGRVAQAIAEKISLISRNSQVLCITHLPQVAAIADHHYFIAKHVIDGRTETHVKFLNNSERVQELARMLSGSKITELTLEHAQELFKMAKEIRKNKTKVVVKP
ncbi:MAG: DNA repair protein RecN [Ligilactobacillus ruminis]